MLAVRVNVVGAWCVSRHATTLQASGCPRAPSRVEIFSGKKATAPRGGAVGPQSNLFTESTIQSLVRGTAAPPVGGRCAGSRREAPGTRPARLSVASRACRAPTSLSAATPTSTSVSSTNGVLSATRTVRTSQLCPSHRDVNHASSDISAHSAPSPVILTSNYR